MLALRYGSTRFSTAAITNRTHAKFQEKYQANIEAFKRKVSESEVRSDGVKKSTQKVFVHPFEDAHRPIGISAMTTLRTENEFMGAEQVSPHYEHFSYARRHALIFWVGVFGFDLISKVEDIHIFGKSAYLSWMFMYSYLYWYVEGRKFIALPLLNRFYNKITTMEMMNCDNYYTENMENKVREMMAVAKSQIDYRTVHNDYLYMRNNTLLNFLINEQISLKNHIYSRSQSILKQAEEIEENNYSKIMSGVMSEILESIDQAYDQHKEQIEKDMFQLALQGISQGKMDYSKDPVLPYVQQTISQIVQKFNAISKEDQEKMVCLTEPQFGVIRAADQRQRDDYLNNEPKIEGTLRNNPIVAKILDRWGNKA